MTQKNQRQAALLAAIANGDTRMVYFLRGGPMVKIGVSKWVQLRIKTLQTGCPYKLELLGTVPGGYQLEVYLHNKYRRQRSHSEWFLLTDELCTEINDLLSAHGSRVPVGVQ